VHAIARVVFHLVDLILDLEALTKMARRRVMLILDFDGYVLMPRMTIEVRAKTTRIPTERFNRYISWER
jgi:hypothetical protein